MCATALEAEVAAAQRLMVLKFGVAVTEDEVAAALVEIGIALSDGRGVVPGGECGALADRRGSQLRVIDAPVQLLDIDDFGRPINHGQTVP